MKKSGLADSPFFSMPPSSAETDSVPAVGQLEAQQVREKKRVSDMSPAASKQSKHDTTIPRYRDTTVPRYHDTTIELVRKAVKEFGKEAATHRFTLAEKQAIADLIHAYKSQGIRTSENEIARIAINFLIHDHQENAKNSILEKVLKALSR